jgi:Xaa-Pro aminopeptidase
MNRWLRHTDTRLQWAGGSGQGEIANLPTPYGLPAAACTLMITVYSDVMPLDVAAVQESLRSDGLDAWLLYDFNGSNPIAARLAGLANGSHMTTRRWYYLIPASGSPRALVHAIERRNLDKLPGEKQTYAGREQLAAGLDRLLRGVKRVAMEYSPQGAIPYISRVDAGTAEMVRSRGVDIVSSGDLVQRFEAIWTPAQYAQHMRASDALYRIKDRAFDRVRVALKDGERMTEYDLQQQMVHWFDDEGLLSDSAPDVALGANAGNPHYLPLPEVSAVIVPNQILLLDLWGKMREAGAVFADITWVGFTGMRIPDEAARAFDAIVRARDTAVALVEEAAMTGRELHGWEVDRAAHDVLVQSGYGPHILHRTGHSLGETVHGNGVHLDDYETHDDRRILPGTGFTIEPGLYFDSFGVRTEINVFRRDRDVVVSGPRQMALVSLEM